MKTYKKYYIVPATPPEVFLALTNPLTLTLWTGSPAVMEKEVNSEFSLWDESIVGKNLSFTQDKEIVQQWYFGDHEPSIVTIKLHPHKRGTSVELTHTNIPPEDYQNITSGWDEDYFGALIDFYTEPPEK